jgi:hypothetical protein
MTNDVTTLTALLNAASLDPIGPVPDCGRCELGQLRRALRFGVPCETCALYPAVDTPQVDPHGPVKRVDMVWELIGLD